MKTRKKPIRIALVMPTHIDIHSSLANFIKTYQHLIRKGLIEVTLFTDAKNGDVSIPFFKIEKIRGADYKTPIEKALFLLGVPRFYYPDLANKLEGFDVITANNPEFYAYAYQAYLAAKKKGVRFVLRTSQTVHGFFLYGLTKFFVNPLVRSSYEYSRKLIFTNPEAEERCLRLGLISDSKKSIITGHATDTESFRPIPSLRKKRKGGEILLSVGGLLKLKGHQYIISALKIVKEEFPNAQLLIVGKGPYESSLKEHAASLGLLSSVKFLGAKGHEDLVKLYNKSDVFVLANEQEITPAVNEALSCEVPVVVMECGGMKFVLPDDSYGLASKKNDEKDMAEKIRSLLRDRKLGRDIAKKGRSRILSEFSIEKVAEKLYRSFTE